MTRLGIDSSDRYAAWPQNRQSMGVSLDVMHSKPGIYLVVFSGQMVFVETDQDGACFQLKPATFERDGELISSRWNPATIDGIFGPLARIGAVT